MEFLSEKVFDMTTWLGHWVAQGRVKVQGVSYVSGLRDQYFLAFGIRDQYFLAFGLRNGGSQEKTINILIK